MGLLSLEQWRREISYHPWHFWGLSGYLAPVSSSCNTLVNKYSWQAQDAMGRENIKEAIDSAEETLVPHLQYYPAPRWVEETYQFPRHPQPDIYRLGYAASDGRWEPLRMKHTKIISVGYQYTTLIATCAVTYEDKDGDGLKEQFTVSCPTTVTNPDNIKLFFASTERYDGQGLVEDYEVRPIRVSIAGGIATIVGNSWLLVKPVLYEGVGVIGNPEGTELDASLAANYATNVDVAYWRIDPNGTTYETAQATLIWETTPFPMWASSTAGTSDPAAVAYAIGRVGIRDSDDGIVTVSEAYYDTVTGQWYGIPWYDSTNKFRPPDRVKIRYLSGVPLVNGMMNKRMSTVVARLSAAESPRRICACDEANRALHHWQFDLARTSGEGSESYGAISAADLNNPLGTRRGQVMAFKAIRLLRDFRGFST